MDFIDSLSDFLASYIDEEHSFENVAIQGMYQIVQQLKFYLKRNNFNWKLDSLYYIFDQLVKGESLSFQGEPLNGLQIMGMLETRTLDYKNIVFTSLNEGILPKSSLDQSFIPFDIKRALNMPTYYEKDAVYAYHFFRLFKQAEQVKIIYNSDYNQYGGGEMSRFIHLLELRPQNHR